MAKIKIMQVGLGPIGQKAVKYVLGRDCLELVAAVDPASDKAGKDIADICDIESKPDIIISPDLASAVRTAKPDVAILTTVSSFEKCVPHAKEILKLGIHVVSTCEEMSYPWQTNPELAEQLDKTAKENNVAILATGINPGFLMDFLPLAVTAVCQKVEKIKVSRLQDATFRRIPFQQKIGAGLTLEQFEEKRKTGTLRHVGLTESIDMIAGTLGWKLDKTEDILSPVIAESKITSGYRVIEHGMAAGVRQIGKGWVNGKELITLEFIAAVGLENPADTVEIRGMPNITSIIPGGVNGDIGTCAITVNAVKSIINAKPGLRTMADIPVVSFFENL